MSSSRDTGDRASVPEFAALARASGLNALEVLDLSFNKFGAAGAEALAASEPLSRLRMLYLAGQRFGKKVQALLDAKFGDRVR